MELQKDSAMKPNLAKLEISADIPGWVPHDIRILDAQGRLVQGFDGESIQVPFGEYRIRVEAYSQIIDTLVNVSESKMKRIVAAPVPIGEKLSQFGYSEYLKSLSDLLYPEQGDRTQTKLIISVLNISNGQLSADALQGVTLTDVRGSPVVDLQSLDKSLSAEGNHLIVAASLEPGFYRLQYIAVDGSINCLPLHIFQEQNSPESGGRRWHLHVKVYWNKRLLIEDAVINTADTSIPSFDEYASELLLADGIAESLLVGFRSEIVKATSVSNMLNEKYRNPLLGMMGAHIALMNPKISSETIKTILDNLGELVPGSPDYLALVFRAYKKGFIRHLPENLVLKDIPMLSLSADVIYEVLMDNEFQLELQVDLERFYMNRCKVGIWSSYTRVNKNKFSRRKSILWGVESDIFQPDTFLVIADSKRPLAQGDLLHGSSVQHVLVKSSKNDSLLVNKHSLMAGGEMYASPQEKGLANWLRSEIRNSRKKVVNKKQITAWAAQAGVLPITIEKILKKIDSKI